MELKICVSTESENDLDILHKVADVLSECKQKMPGKNPAQPNVQGEKANAPAGNSANSNGAMITAKQVSLLTGLLQKAGISQ